LNNENGFHPKYTHQIFGEDEMIVGFKNYKLNIYYHASSLSTFMEQSFESKMTKDADPLTLLTKKPIPFPLNGTEVKMKLLTHSVHSI
jgi:hypothetical protein